MGPKEERYCVHITTSGMPGSIVRFAKPPKSPSEELSVGEVNYSSV